MSDVKTGQIANWNEKKGFGFLDHDGKRVFLHIREYAERHHFPRKGDKVLFRFGIDERGRPCAKNVREVAPRSRLQITDIFCLLSLLILPLLAAIHLPFPLWTVVAVSLFLSLFSWCNYSADKKRATRNAWRIPEGKLHFIDLLGGWPGGFLAQNFFRHKTIKGSFQTIFRGTILLHQMVAFDCLGDWGMLKALGRMIVSLG